jgi:hypothetical protein
MRTQSVIFEELIVAIDAAGKLQGDDMEQGANPKTFSPAWAQGIEQMHVLAMSNGDQLGASVILAILSGAAFPDGPHEIPIGGHGGENIDLANEGSKPTPLIDMGIVVKPGKTYKIEFQALGDTMDEFGCSVELVFQDEPVRQPKHWESLNATTATVNVEVQGTDLSSTATTLSPGDSVDIGGFIGCAAGDMAALGVNHLVGRLSKALEDDSDFILGGVGGELIIGSGAHLEPTQRAFVSYRVKKNQNVYGEFMSIIEAGVMSGAYALGFVVSGQE